MTTFAGQWGPYPLDMPDAWGRPSTGVAFEVLLTGTTTLATTYADRLKTNPSTIRLLKTDQYGSGKFFADPNTAAYDIRMGGRIVLTGITVPFDEAEEQTAIPAGTFAQALNPTAVKTSAYTAAPKDYVLIDTTAGTVAITLPTAPADGTRIGIKIVAPSPAVNVATFACGGSDHINLTTGPTTGTLTLTNQAVILQYASSNAVWTVQSSDLPLSQLDTRFQATIPGGTYAGIAAANTFTGGDQTISQGYLRVSDQRGTANGPQVNLLGFSGEWFSGIDVANAPLSRDLVLAGKASSYWVNDAVVTSGSAVVTSASEGNFSTLYNGAAVSGAGIPPGASLTVNSATQFTLSANATASGSPVRLKITLTGVTDLVYLRHNGAKSPTIGLGVTPPDSSSRVQVAAADAEPSMGTIRLRVGSAQTGKALTVHDSTPIDRWWVDKDFFMSGLNPSTGSALAVQADTNGRPLAMCDNAKATVYGWEYSSTNLRFRYLSGSVSILQFDTAGGIFVYNPMTIGNKIIFSDNTNIQAGTTTGTKIGTGTTQKLGFWNAAPVVQQARPTDAASIITLLTTLGLCA
jgi:hypothetical protein